MVSVSNEAGSLPSNIMMEVDGTVVETSFAKDKKFSGLSHLNAVAKA